MLHSSHSIDNENKHVRTNNSFHDDVLRSVFLCLSLSLSFIRRHAQRRLGRDRIIFYSRRKLTRHEKNLRREILVTFNSFIVGNIEKQDAIFGQAARLPLYPGDDVRKER